MVAKTEGEKGGTGRASALPLGTDPMWQVSFVSFCAAENWVRKSPLRDKCLSKLYRISRGENACESSHFTAKKDKGVLLQCGRLSETFLNSPEKRSQSEFYKVCIFPIISRWELLGPVWRTWLIGLCFLFSGRWTSNSG